MVIEDEKDVRELLQLELKNEGFTPLALESGHLITQKIQEFQPQVILLDQLLPGKTGMDIMKEIRSNTRFNNIPIIVVSALIAENDKVQALNFGADDYITKPFTMKELIARVRAMVRRSESSYLQKQSQLTYGKLKMDFSAHKVTLNTQEIPLTLTEFKILSELLKQNGQVLSRDRLRERALGNLNVTDRTIDVHMASLRKKLSDMGNNIETVRGVGYRFS